jgi:ribosome-binding factor A
MSPPGESLFEAGIAGLLGLFGRKGSVARTLFRRIGFIGHGGPLDGEITDPRLEGARITMVEMSRDGSRARSWFAMPPCAELEHREIAAAFDRAAGFFRQRLCEALLLKRIPELTKDLPDSLRSLRSAIEKSIPVGRDQHDAPALDTGSTDVRARGGTLMAQFASLEPRVQRLSERAACQLGTLGGGNHFIEVCLDTEERVWLMLHSGSRHIGNALADHHIGVSGRTAACSTKRPGLTRTSIASWNSRRTWWRSFTS